MEVYNLCKQVLLYVLNNFAFNCDLSNVVYLFDCVVFGFQYVRSTSTPFRHRFNNHKACFCKFNSRSSVPQVDLFRHLSEENHHGFLEDIRVKIIGMFFGGGIGYMRVSGNIS